MMNCSALPPDDLPPEHLMPLDEGLKKQLEGAISRYLYQNCDGVIQSLLTSCQWSIATRAGVLVLSILCLDTIAHERVLHNVRPLATSLKAFANGAQIQIYHSSQPEPLEITVDDILGVSVYTDAD
jgi:hypothetical protein